ncbi:MAG TPA: hypothetical protein VLH13_03420, partial [Methanomassiliicoccales archaeon]|nr:hypothetical protein [Methanomassiliicoccales archaeon]
MALILPLLLLLSLALFAPMVSAQDVNIKSLDSQSKDLPAESSTSFRWVLYNNDTSTLVVQISTDHAAVDGITVTFEPDYAVLEAGDSATIVATFAAIRAVENEQIQYNINFTATTMGDISVVRHHSEVVNVKVISIWTVDAGANRILGLWNNTLPAPLDGNEGAFLVTSLCWIVIGLFFYFVVDPTVRLLTKKTKSDLDDIILRILRMPVFLLIVLVGTVWSLEILDLPAKTIADIETDFQVFLIVIGAWLAYKIYSQIVLFYAKRYAEKTDSEVDDVLVPVLEKIGMVLIPFLAMMLVFETFGYDVTVLLAGAGFLGIVVGFAAQSTLANLF